MFASGVKKVNHWLWWLQSQQKYPSHNSVQHIYEEWDIPINVHR